MFHTLCPSYSDVFVGIWGFRTNIGDFNNKFVISTRILRSSLDSVISYLPVGSLEYCRSDAVGSSVHSVLMTSAILKALRVDHLQRTMWLCIGDLKAVT